MLVPGKKDILSSQGRLRYMLPCTLFGSAPESLYTAKPLNEAEEFKFL